MRLAVMGTQNAASIPFFRYHTSYDVIFQTLGVFAGGKAAEKFLSRAISQSVQCQLSFALNFMRFLVKNFCYDVTTQTLGVSAGGNAAEKISVTYHFINSAM